MDNDAKMILTYWAVGLAITGIAWTLFAIFWMVLGGWIRQTISGKYIRKVDYSVERKKHECNTPDLFDIQYSAGTIWQCRKCGTQYELRAGGLFGLSWSFHGVSDKK